MPTAPTLTNCPNCGSTIQDTIVAPLTTCEYCGTKLTGLREVSQRMETYLAKKNITEDNLSRKIAEWLQESTTENETAIRFDAISLLWTRLAYYPAYIYRGNVAARWQLLSDVNISGSINDDFSAHAYARIKVAITHDDDEQPGGPAFVSRYAAAAVARAFMEGDDLIPADDKDRGKGIFYDATLDPDAAWKLYGNKAAKNKLTTKLYTSEYRDKINGSAELTRGVKFNITETAKLYIPVWDVCFLYNGQQYYMALNAVSGGGDGDEIDPIDPNDLDDGIEKHLKAIYFIGLWILWGVMRMYVIPKGNIFNGFSTYFDNALISKMGEDLWSYRQGVVVLICIIGTFIAKKLIPYRRKLNATPDQKDNKAFVKGQKKFGYAKLKVAGLDT